MRGLGRWLAVALLPCTAGCFYNYSLPSGGSSTGAGQGTGTGGSSSSGTGAGSTSGGAASTGSSTGNGNSSSTGSNGSTGSSASTGPTGGSTSSGGSTGYTGPPPFVPTFPCGADAGFPTSCKLITISSVPGVINVPSPLGAVGVVGQAGGSYLVGAVAGGGGDSEMFTFLVDADGGVSAVDAGAFANSQGFSPGSVGPPATLLPLSFVPNRNSAALVAVDDSNAPFSTQLDCADPFDASPSVLAPAASAGETTTQAQAAAASDGTLALVWSGQSDVDSQSGALNVFGLGPAGGGCPTTFSNLPTLSNTPGGAAIPLIPSIAAMPSDAGASFVIAETLVSAISGATLSYLGLWTLSDAGVTTLVASTAFGSGNAASSGVASVRNGAVVVGADSFDGGFLFTVGDAGALVQGPQLMSTCAANTNNLISMTACGPDCVLVAWFDFPGGCRTHYQPVYAFINPEGCGVAGTFPEFDNTSDDAWPLAVASQAGSAVVAYGANLSGQSEIQIQYCTVPP